MGSRGKAPGATAGSAALAHLKRSSFASLFLLMASSMMPSLMALPNWAQNFLLYLSQPSCSDLHLAAVKVGPSTATAPTPTEFKAVRSLGLAACLPACMPRLASAQQPARGARCTAACSPGPRPLSCRARLTGKRHFHLAFSLASWPLRLTFQGLTSAGRAEVQESKVHCFSLCYHSRTK